MNCFRSFNMSSFLTKGKKFLPICFHFVVVQMMELIISVWIDCYYYYILWWCSVLFQLVTILSGISTCFFLKWLETLSLQYPSVRMSFKKFSANADVSLLSFEICYLIFLNQNLNWVTYSTFPCFFLFSFHQHTNVKN